MFRSFGLVLLSTLVLCISGCQSEVPSNASNADKPAKPPSAADAHDHSHDEHGHPKVGPHHGPLIELGNEEFHAEIVHDDVTGTVTIYLLDAHAEKIVTTGASEAIINLKHGDTPEQFKLAAQPEEGNPMGQTSRFTLTDKELIAHLHDAAAGTKLNVTIGDTPYSGSIPAEGDATHNHEHGDSSP